MKHNRKANIRGNFFLKLLSAILLVISVWSVSFGLIFFMRFSSQTLPEGDVNLYKCSQQEIRDIFVENVSSNMVAKMLEDAKSCNYVSDIWSEYLNTNLSYSVVKHTLIKEQEFIIVPDVAKTMQYGGTIHCDAVYSSKGVLICFVTWDYDEYGEYQSYYINYASDVGRNGYTNYLNLFFTQVSSEVQRTIQISDTDRLVTEQYLLVIPKYEEVFDGVREVLSNSSNTMLTDYREIYSVRQFMTRDFMDNIVVSHMNGGEFYTSSRVLSDDIFDSVFTSAVSEPIEDKIAGDSLVYYEIEYCIKGEIDTSLKDDPCVKALIYADIFYYAMRLNAPLVIAGVLIGTLMIIYLCAAAGYHGKYGFEVRLSFFDKQPLLVLTVITALIDVILLVIMLFCYDIDVDRVTKYMLLAFFESVFVLISVFYLMSLSVRIKSRRLFYYLIKLVDTLSKHKLMGFMVVLLWALVSGCEFAVISAASETGGTYRTVFFAAYGAIKLLEVVVVSYLLSMTYKITEGMERVAAGEYSMPIDTSRMLPSFRRHAENINRASDGISNAVYDKIKSERLKTELITNVSHDIKTPLTTIINYVDLISKEKVDNANVEEYSQILSRQSIRLKKLIEDLIEASKASTGNIEMNIVELNIDRMLIQAIGEFSERISASHLELIVNKEKDSNVCLADSRYLWRVFDNLLVNICKYSMPSTRVYIDINDDEEKLYISFKNISKNPLNMKGSELMERFVRGDSSRNTEGSGLGLSIAQSLLALMGGELVLTIDGDLFKATCVMQKPVMKEVEDGISEGGLPEGVADTSADGEV